MAFGEPGDPDAEAARIGMFPGFVERADVGDEIGRIAEMPLRPIVTRLVLRRIAAQGENVGDPRFGITGEYGIHLIPGVADTCQVGDGRDAGGFLDADHKIMREFARGAAGPVGNGDEGRGEGLKIAYRFVKVFPCSRGAWREEFEGE